MKLPVNERPTFSLGKSPKFERLAALARKDKKTWRKVANLTIWAQLIYSQRLTFARFSDLPPDQAFNNVLKNYRLSDEIKGELRNLYYID